MATRSKPLTAAKVRAVLREAEYEAHGTTNGFNVFIDDDGALCVSPWPKPNPRLRDLFDIAEWLEDAGIDAQVSLSRSRVVCRGYL